MSIHYSSLGKVALLLILARYTFAQSCISFGVDFQDGGSYFQNSLSSDPFTYVSEFEGCDVDVANNLLVDPSGNQTQCSDTPLTPPKTPEMSTCPLDKNQLTSGAWSVLILSNNGNGNPIAYQRDFSLLVGPQKTFTVTPTITVPVTSTPVVNSTTIYRDIHNSTAATPTVTVPSMTISPTTTTTPQKVTSTTTKVLTITKTMPKVTINHHTVTVTATCSIPGRQNHPDPTCRIKPTLVHAAALEGPKASAKATSTPWRESRFQMRQVDPLSLLDKRSFIAERAARLEAAGEAALVKRAPDQSILTVTDTDTAHYGTITKTITAAPSTLWTTTTTVVTSTVTPLAVTVIKGRTTLPMVTVTAPTPTRVVTKNSLTQIWVTKSYSYDITITTTTTPAAVKTQCRSVGGWLNGTPRPWWQV